MEVFADATPQHRRGHISVTTFFLRLVKHVQYDALLVREPVPDIGNVRISHLRIRTQRAVDSQWKQELHIRDCPHRRGVSP